MTGPRRRRIAGVVLVAGPALWMLHLLVSYGLVYLTCRPGGSWWLHLATAVSVVAIAAAVAIGVRRWRAFRATQRVAAESQDGNGWATVEMAGWFLAVFFLLVTVMAGVASAVVGPCI